MDQPPLSSESPPPASPAAPTSLWSRLANVFVDPGEVFEEVKTAAPSVKNWLVPTLIYGVVTALASVMILTQPEIVHKSREARAKAIDQQVAAEKMTREQADQALAAQEKFSGPTTMKIVGGIWGFIQAFIELVGWAILLWLIGRVCLKGRISFMKTVEVAGLAGMIATLEALLRVLLIVGTGNALASPSLALLVKDPSPQNKLFLALGLVNPVIYWLLAVRSIGLAKLCDVSIFKAAAWVFLLWLLLMGTCLGSSLALQAAFAK